MLAARGILQTFASDLELVLVFVFVLSFLLATIGVAFGLAKFRQMRWEKKILNMRQMGDPNYFMCDGESLSR